MLVPILTVLCSVLCSCAAAYFLVNRTFAARVAVLERDLQNFSEAMCQMAEIQMKGYQKLTGNVGEIEERILELAVPSSDSRLPLERRHQVLSLSRKGVAVDEIVNRLNLPRGEADLILNLQKYTDVAAPKNARANGESKRYVQA
jgi:hypothetical protein